MKKIKILVAICLISFSLVVRAQVGTNDPTFNTNDLGYYSGIGFNVAQNNPSSAFQSDGKLIVAGNFTSYNYISIIKLARFNTDGTIDLSFNPGTSTNETIESIALQPDGKIIIGGTFTSYNGTFIRGIARINSNGTLDNSFVPQSNLDMIFHVRDICLQNDGKIIVAGNFNTYGGIDRKNIVRLNSNGTIDTSFNPGTGFDRMVLKTQLQNDGKIIVGGDFLSFNNLAANKIIRLNSNGTRDTSFNIGNGFNGLSFVSAIKTLNNGNILVGGSFSQYKGVTTSGLVNIDSTGNINTTFNISGTLIDVSEIQVQNDNKILIAGNFSTVNNISRASIARLEQNGTLDLSFETIVNNAMRSINIQNDGKIIVIGNANSYNNIPRNYMARLNSDGSVDKSHNPVTGANSGIYQTEIQPDGKIIIVGTFTTYNEAFKNRITRINSDGSNDTSFNISGTGANNSIWTTALQSDGKVFIGGDFTSYNSVSATRIARLNPTGSLDNTFYSLPGPNDRVNSILIQPNGSILVAGNFTTYYGFNHNRLIRLNNAGNIIDATFNIGTGFNNSIRCMALQNDGKIIVGGLFVTINGVNRNCIVRLNSDGSIDQNFNIGTGANLSVHSIKIQPDGKIIVGGFFTSFNGISCGRIVRLNSNGSIDASFSTGTGFNAVPRSINLQADGKILVAGDFTNFNGNARNYIVRLNENGTLDNSFNIGTGADDTMESVNVQPDNKIIIAGWFASYNGIGRNCIARLNNSVLPISFLKVQLTKRNEKDILVQWNVGNEWNMNKYEVEYSDNGYSFSKIAGLNAKGNKKENEEYEFIDLNNRALVNHYYRIKAIDKDGSFKLSSVAKISSSNDNKIKISTAPNPVTDILNISVSNSKIEKATIKIFSANGVLAKEQSIQLINGSVSFQLNCKELASGTYSLIMQKKDEAINKIFIKL